MTIPRLTFLITSGLFLIAPMSFAGNAGVTPEGIASKATFDGKITLNGQPTSKTIFDATDKIDIAFDVGVAPEHVGKLGYFYVAVNYDNVWIKKESNSTWSYWNHNMEDLMPVSSTTSLKAKERISVQNNLSLLMGDFKVYVGYRAIDDVQLNLDPFSFSVIVIPECS